MKTPLVTFFSDIDNRTYYSDHAKRFVKNCKDLNIPFIVRELQSKGDYRLNCLSKPKFILEMMKEINIPFVWIDVDTIIHQQLNVFDDLSANCDIGMAFEKIPTDKDPSISLPKASPIFINNTSKAIDFLYKWNQAADKIKSENIPVFDHELLVKIFIENIKNIRIACLPPSYCIWPGKEFEGDKFLTMGLADTESKQNKLKEMGISEKEIERQSIGNKFVEIK